MSAVINPATKIYVSVDQGIATLPSGQAVNLLVVQETLNNAFQATGEDQYSAAANSIADMTGAWQEAHGDFVALAALDQPCTLQLPGALPDLRGVDAGDVDEWLDLISHGRVKRGAILILAADAARAMTPLEARASSSVNMGTAYALHKHDHPASRIHASEPVNSSVAAIFLWQGIAKDKFEKLAERHGGQIGVADWVSEFATLVERKYLTLPDDLPGVFHYEVAESMGRWLGEQDSPTSEAFNVELDRQTQGFLNQLQVSG